MTMATACALPTHSYDKEYMLKQNRDAAERIFHVLTVFHATPNDKPQQRYIKSFAKHVYRWARMSAYHAVYFGETTNDKKIENLMNLFSTEFSKKYLPPMDNTAFYELYPSKPLLQLFEDFETKTQRKQKLQLLPSITQKHDISTAAVADVSEDIRPQKVLFITDWDDTLIPSHLLKAKKFQITKKNTTKREQIEFDEYSKALNNFMDTLLSLFNYNKQRNIQILTNAATIWVQEDSMFHSGRLFAEKMAEFAEKLGRYKIDIISASDNWMEACKHDKTGSIRSMNPYKWKWEILKHLYREQFGRRLDGSYDVKVISLGDSYQSEYLGAGVAFSGYLAKQNPKKTKNTNISLHRIKFIDEPTLPQLTKQLIWCTKNLPAIVLESHKSHNYMLSEKI